MNTEFQGRVLEIFDESLQQAAGARSSFIKEACAGNTALIGEVESLLTFAADAEDFIEQPLLRLPGRGAVDLAEGDLVDRYRIVRRVGRGGMGTVYLAVHDDPDLEMMVALKVVNPDRTDPEAISRFREEVRMLAKLEHPNIVRPLDRGTTDDGRPYLVMEYIRGLPIDQYCKDNKLSIAKRLELFRKVCSTVHFAHQNLIVHRDLKPSNILVTDQNEPKLLDFGIARLLEPSPYSTSAETLREKTAAGFLGTLRYSSPEQVRNINGLTTTSDVYSLGVLLYELLTGHYPYQKWSSSFLDLSEAICKRQPEKPSTAVGLSEAVVTPEGKSDAVTPERVSAARADSPAVLKRRLSGDLDSIVLKALRKEPDARYASAEEMSEDLRRHQEGHPVEARHSTFSYQAGRFIRRHRTQMVIVAGFLMLIIAFGAIMAWLWKREEEAKEARERALFVADYVGALFEIRNPEQGRTVTAREILDEGIEDLRKAMRMDELSDEEKTLLLEQLPEDLPGLMDAFGWAYYGLGDYAEAESLLTQSVDRRRAAETEPTPDLVLGLVRLSAARSALGDAAGAAALRGEALEYIHRGEVDDKRLTQVLSDLALLLEDRGDNQAAEEIYGASLPMSERLFGGRSASDAIFMTNRAALLVAQGRLEEAETLYRRSLALRRDLFGPESDAVARCLYSLASLLRDAGVQDPARSEKVWEEAETLFRQSLDIRRQLHPENDPKIAYVLLNLAVLQQLRGALEEAGSLYDQALEIFRNRHGENDYVVAIVLQHQATLLQTQGRAVEAEATARTAVDNLRASLGPDHPRTAAAESVLGDCLLDLGRLDEAAPLLERSLPIIEDANGERSRATAEARQRFERLESLRSSGG